VLPALVLAQNTTNVTAASTFYLDKTETQFSVNIANDSQDVFIYFTSPAYSWVGVGFGEKMEGSLMLIVYQNADGDSTSKPAITVTKGTHVLKRHRCHTLPKNRQQSLRTDLSLLRCYRYAPRH
jgi:hypothetical protein